MAWLVTRHASAKRIEREMWRRFIGACQRFDRAFAGVATVLGKSELLKVLEYLGKAAVLVAVTSWVYECPQRRNANIRVAWSVVDSRGGGRREALEYLYENKVSLRGLYGEGGFFGNIDLHGASLAWANLNDSNFEEARLQYADLQDVHLLRAHLTGAHLTGAYLMRADLKGAHLTGAHLNGAHLNGADLSPIRDEEHMPLPWFTPIPLWFHTDMRDTDLTGADLSGADLRGVSGLTQMQVDAAARGDRHTKLPAGIVAPKSWTKQP